MMLSGSEPVFGMLMHPSVFSANSDRELAGVQRAAETNVTLYHVLTSS